MTGWTPLFQQIIGSSIWGAENHIRIAWITMLAVANKDGIAPVTAGGLARLANISREEAAEALEALSSPDDDTLTQEFEGRRIERCDTGWRLLNFVKYRDMAKKAIIREQNRTAQAEWRASQDDDAEAPTSGTSETSTPPAIIEITTAWNKVAEASGLPQCVEMSPGRRKSLNSRLKEPFFCDNWKAALAKVTASDFCKGISDRGWRATFDWFIAPDSVTKTIEGKYDNGTHQPNPTKGVDRNAGTLNAGKADQYARVGKQV